MKILLISILILSTYGKAWVNEDAMEAILERGRHLR